MFHPLGLFKSIQCPRSYDCVLHNCIFGHDITNDDSAAKNDTRYDPSNASTVEEPPPKRRKIESLRTEAASAVLSSPQPQPTVQVKVKPKDESPIIKAELPLAKQNDISGERLTPASVKRAISPPLTTRKFESAPDKAEKLIPRPVAKAPATLKVRLSLVEHIYKQMKVLDQQLAANEKEAATSDQRLIQWVLDEEEQAATKLASEIYRNAMSQKVLQLKRMKLEDWKSFVKEKLVPATATTTKPDESTTGLSPNEDIQILRYLRTNLTGLDSHGYVTKSPSENEITKAKEATRAAAGFETCDRCGVRFQVFPGRDEQGRLTTKGECLYHWGKLNRGQWHKTDHITGQSQASFPCCGRSPGSEGCSQAATHVFKVSDSKRLAALLQFEQTPVRSDGKTCRPMAFDCEMAYTTYGMEVVRVTAVSWPENEELLDVLVRPFGEILDLNTRFSGVTQEQFARALPYEAANNPSNSTAPGGEKPRAGLLQKVDSPKVARRLLFDLLCPDTPLLGHAIDNDLNCCRIIHPFVIDTVLLYPHPRGLPMRFGLKALASKYLHRSIQTGGEAGHDSKEDSVATGDLVKIKVAEKWQMMRLQGWKFREGSLLPPGRL